MKSERLKKLEVELNDLEQWLKLGLVPKKDMDKHKEEIRAIQTKIEEEKERLKFLKESGEAEEYIAPKRPTARAGYTEMPTIPDIDMGDTGAGIGDTAFDMETDAIDVESSVIEEKDETEDEEGATRDENAEEEEEEEESYFSDRNRWRRGGIIDPDADEW
ncbi:MULTISPECIES: hypothetical protein [unclassified Neochlamydia]|uniref:hypothetical protein n=1 Tax=unclassified Neochlamydia TaxID=2643326 RepID=UPI00057CA6AC